MFVIERLPEPDQLRGSGTFLLPGVLSEVADDVQDRALRQQRR